MNKVKILAVGIGGYGNIFIESYLKKQRPDCTLVGAVDVYPQGCRYYQQLVEMGVPIYSDMEAFFAEGEADLTVISTPIHLHTRQILTALAHGSDVICEKPLSADSKDEKILCEARDKAGKFVMIGYQWSYSEAINTLKRDITAGKYGTPEFMKCIVLWPRTKSYFTRGIGWGGKLRAEDGTPLNDSVVNNATAHYPHNILYVLGGADGRAAEVVDLKADLVRINDIENFDTATIRFTLDNGAEGIYVASHATLTANEPEFEYRFSGGVVCYDSHAGRIMGKLHTGEIIDYGDPFDDVTIKYWKAVDAVLAGGVYTPLCGIETAASQVRFIETLQQTPIKQINHALRCEREDGLVYIKDGAELLRRCYDEEKLLSETDEYRNW